LLIALLASAALWTAVATGGIGQSDNDGSASNSTNPLVVTPSYPVHLEAAGSPR
jgi:hypothetical protein